MKDKSMTIKQYLAWMDIYNNGNKTELLKLIKKEEETCIESFIPKLEITISITDKDPVIAFDSFFELFGVIIEKYLLDNPGERKVLEKRIDEIQQEVIRKTLQEENLF